MKTVYAKLVQRVILALLTLLLVAGCGRSEEALIDQISNKDLSELSLKLFHEGILAEVSKNSDGTYKVMVNKDQYVTANEILLNLGIFRNDNQDKILKLATKASMVETPLEQRFKFNQIVSQELSSTLSNLHNVIYADVYISSDLSDQDNNINFAQDSDALAMPVKASVFLKVNSMMSGSPEELINNAKKIVAGAIKGLATDNIYVVIENS